MKKSKKLFLVASMAFFVSTSATFAQSLNKDELKTAIEKINPNADMAYVIGKYVFTTQHELTTQDVMFAARSINGEFNGNTDWSKMTINRIDFTIENGVSTGINVGTPYVGNESISLDSDIDIDYIDYYSLDENTRVNVDALIQSAESKINEKKLFNGTFENGTLTVTVLDVNKVFTEGMGSNIFSALQDIMKSEGIKALTLSYNGLEFTYDDTKSLPDILAWLNANSQTIFSKNFSDVKGEDLKNKSFDLNVTLDDTKLSTNGNPSESYKVKFVTDQESTDKLVQEAINTQKLFDDNKVKFENNNVEVTIDTLDKELKEGIGSQLLVALENIESNDKVESVEFQVDGLKYNTEQDGDAITWLKSNCETIFGKKLSELKESDLLGKDVKVTINLKVENSSASNEYNVSFKNVLNSDEYNKTGQEAMNTINGMKKFDIKVDEEKKEITVGVDSLETELGYNEVAGTGLQTAMTKYLKNENIRSLNFSVNGINSVEVTADNAEDAATDLYTQLILSLQKQKISYSDLANANITVQVNLADGITFEDGSSTVGYTLKIAQKNAE